VPKVSNKRNGFNLTYTISIADFYVLHGSKLSDKCNWSSRWGTTNRYTRVNDSFNTCNYVCLCWIECHLPQYTIIL